ncbi:nucleotidyltransferase family protein [Candidatus Parcubacteria bacterium]|nr:nucleotidyltransferase family protein [Candidatus Parcubacteria bacterium]
MTNKDIIKKVRPILEKQGVKKAALFGSRARGDHKRSSDVDLLIEYEKDNKSLFDFVGLKFNLEDILKKKVDLLTYDSIHPLLKGIILNEQKIIYEKRF